MVDSDTFSFPLPLRSNLGMSASITELNLAALPFYDTNRSFTLGAELINLSHSGLDQSEACWVRRLARAIGESSWYVYNTVLSLTRSFHAGANIAPNFSRRSTHLLCPSGIGAKAEKAQEWGGPSR